MEPICISSPSNSAASVVAVRITSRARKPDEYGNQSYTEIAKAAGRISADEDVDGYDGTLSLSDYLRVPTESLDGFLHRAALSYAHQQDDEWLNTTIDALGIDYTTEFELTSEYLELYTKEQLVGLAREARVKGSTAVAAAKKSALITAILADVPDGFVPKQFAKAGSALT
jgi:hypothetical protein